MTLYACFIPGAPVPWQRTAGNGTRRFTNARYKAWSQGAEVFMRAAARGRREPLAELVGLKLIVHLPRPKSRPTWVEPGVWETGCSYMTTGMGDLDNYAKAVADSLQRAGVLADDKQIVQSWLTKQHAARGQQPGLEVLLHAPTGIARSACIA